ncbi:MAG: AidA/PixA family protein [Cyclobacteriaceae bacterium]
MENRRSFIKKSGLLLALGSLSQSAFALVTKRDPHAANITITLYVDTSQIDNRNVDSACNFGQDPGISNREFTVDVNLGDTITWEGVSANAPSTDTVSIESINHEGGKNVFGQNVLRGSGGIVSGTAQYRTDGGEKYKYKISFKVTNNGSNRNGMFHIDPKIAVH